MEKYLISTETLREAKEIARQKNLKENEWKYIPQDVTRKSKIMGTRVSDEKYLIGYFSDNEREYLNCPL
ncbi:hypothetical protein CIW83_18335 [Tissierella sp. P1]|uniref:hypothetical protein n=1 Tax=Tissierella sp. P1 TaxID=1280483 RepID=UPI000BA009E7|nr:hypothetical protein [Tissierella sp. P1]OZV10778.1 hypothetical protein CIW83_18335 [Tissierella sp. P1]